ncbi:MULTISPECIES: integrase core domain-containing protein [Citrobacter]|uniref:integrase core domain-containing protein n=1 Tax=Citrobacter TaxID=544 RepID=UPI00351C33EF
MRKYGRLDWSLLSHPTVLVQARMTVKESVAIYNYERLHHSLKYKTPDDVHQVFYRQKMSTDIRTSHY